MFTVAYVVDATFPDAGTADRFVEWLTGGHTAAVRAGGATSALVMRFPPAERAPARVETVYLFPSEAALRHYLDHYAPALRAEGQRLFGTVPGFAIARRIGSAAGG